MSADEPIETPAEQPSKLAGGCVLAVGAALASGVVYAVPELGYTVAGALAAAGVRRARTWAAGRRAHTDEEEPEAEDVVDILDSLHALSKGEQHVLLTDLKNHAGLPDTKAVRALLDEAGIPIRPGVRAGGKNGPGVHADDVPPLPNDHEPGCLCRSGANTNANNTSGEGPREGLRVDAIGTAGLVITDPTETQRRHTTTPTRSTR